MRLLGAQEIADLLGVSRQRVQQLASGSDFPAPLADLAQGRVWDGDAVRAWAKSHGRLVEESES